MRIIVAFLIACFIGRPALSWSEGGHHLIAVMAYELLTEREQRELQMILAAHPRYAEDFSPPKNVSGEVEISLWRIGRAGYWPEVARRGPYDRPNWHWQLGSSLTIGNVTPPDNPGSVPVDANLKTNELHIAQAVELCRNVLKDNARLNSDRALAACWLAHPVADAHQPCHAGSLYYEGRFDKRDGDRGTNSIPTKQSKNLHALWDGLLGPNFDAGDVRRRAREIMKSESWKDDQRDNERISIHSPFLIKSELTHPMKRADACLI